MNLNKVVWPLSLKACFAGFLLLSLVSCSGSKKEEKNETVTEVCQGDNKTVCEQKKAEKERLERERQEKAAARFRKIFVGLRNFTIVRMDSKEILLNLLVDINNKPRPMLYSLRLDGDSDVIDTQDKTELVQELAPDTSFWISAFKFKNNNLTFIAIEERLLRYTNTRSESASQFVLINLDKSLGNKALLKSQFEFQTRSELQTWAKGVLLPNSQTPSAELSTLSGETK